MTKERNKETGEYDRVMMDSKKEQVIFDTKSLEDLAFEIDRMYKKDSNDNIR